MSAHDTVRECWGADAPAWVFKLAEACDEGDSQAAVARRIGLSPSAISMVLRRRYGVDGRRGNLATVEDRVRAELMGDSVACPAVREDISLARCLEWRERAKEFHPINSERVRMYRACRACPNNGGTDA